MTKHFLMVSISLMFLFNFNVFAQDFNELDLTIDKLIKTHNIKGIGYVAVRDGKILSAKGIGYANDKHKFDTSSSFYIASNTKAFVGLAMAQLIQKGLIKLDSPITEYIDKKYFPKNLDVNKITVKHLLAHSHGLSNDALNFRTAYSGEYPKNLQKLLKFTKQRDTPISHDFRYSNFGYLLSGIIIENVSGKNWRRYVKENVLAKINMKNTRSKLSKNKKLIVFPYSFASDKPLTLKQNNTLHAAGGLFSNLEDMGKWLAFFTAKDISDESQMRKYQELYQTLLVKKADRIGPFGMVGYGFGWTHGKFFNDNLRLHFGTFSGYMSVMSYMPEKNLGFFVIVNEKEAGLQVSLMLTALYYSLMTKNPAKGQINSLFTNVIKQAYKNYKAKKLTLLKVDEIKGLSGNYESEKYGTLKIRKQGENYKFSLGKNLTSLGYKGKTDNEIVVNFASGLYETLFVEKKDNKISIKYDDYEGTFHSIKKK